jgi:hypothetical protein
MCTVDNKKFYLSFPQYAEITENSLLAWGISHFVKHVILEQDVELNQVLNLDKQTVSLIDKRLQEAYNCALRDYKNLLDNQKIYVCAYCPSFYRCTDEFKDYIDSYISYTTNVIREDSKKPRHFYFDTVQEIQNLGFVDDAGVIVFTKINTTNLILKSGFRPYQETALITPMMVLLKGPFSNKYFLTLAKKTIEKRVDRNKYKNIKMILKQNWL